MSCYKRSFKTFFSTFWSYLSVILSDYYSVPVYTLKERLLSGVWLAVCTILLAAFSGKLREQLLKPKPIEWIDSWDDLFEWKHVLVQTMNLSSFMNYLEYFAKDVEKQNMLHRIKAFDYSDFKKDNLDFSDVLDYEGFKEGRVAFVYDEHYLQMSKLNIISDDFQEDIDFHISSSGGISEPLFTIINRMLLDEKYVVIWNKV